MNLYKYTIVVTQGPHEYDHPFYVLARDLDNAISAVNIDVLNWWSELGLEDMKQDNDGPMTVMIDPISGRSVWATVPTLVEDGQPEIYAIDEDGGEITFVVTAMHKKEGA